MIRNDSSLWKTKIMAWNPAECMLLRDEQHHHLGQHVASTFTPIPDTEAQDVHNTIEQQVSDNTESTLDRIAQQPGFIGWEAAMIRELALKHNWRRGLYVHEMNIRLRRNIKPILLEWPFLFLVDDWPRLFKVSVAAARQDSCKEIPMDNDQYIKAMDLRDHGTVSCMAWDSASDLERTEDTALPLVIGGYLRSVRVCDPDTQACVALPDVHHGFPLHVCYLRDQILSVTLDGLITFFEKGLEYRPIRSCTVGTKVIQVTPISFGTQTFQRIHEGSIVTWREVICLAHEDGIVVKDEHSQTLCQIHLDLGSKLLQFQAIADGCNTKATSDDKDTTANASYRRNELLILLEEPNTRHRRILSVTMDSGYSAEISRKILIQNGGLSLGRGGDARESIAMSRDRIAVVSHRNCSSSSMHYCVLRWVDLRENVMVSTEDAHYEDDSEDESGNEDSTNNGDRAVVEEAPTIKSLQDGEGPIQETVNKWTPVKFIQRRGKVMHLPGHEAAYRILAMDHARIVLGVGSKMVKILCLA